MSPVWNATSTFAEQALRRPRAIIEASMSSASIATSGWRCLIWIASRPGPAPSSSKRMPGVSSRASIREWRIFEAALQLRINGS